MFEFHIRKINVNTNYTITYAKENFTVISIQTYSNEYDA